MLKIKKSLYSKQVVFKTAYHFTDSYYLYIDADSENYIINISPKDKTVPENINDIFLNELLAQETREVVLEKTMDIRKLLLGRAFASTIVETTNPTMDAIPLEDDDSVFEDWYSNES